MRLALATDTLATDTLATDTLATDTLTNSHRPMHEDKELTTTPLSQINLLSKMGIRHFPREKADRARKGIVVGPTYKKTASQKEWLAYVGGKHAGKVFYDVAGGYQDTNGNKIGGSLAEAVLHVVHEYVSRHGTRPWEDVHGQLK